MADITRFIKYGSYKIDHITRFMDHIIWSIKYGTYYMIMLWYGPGPNERPIEWPFIPLVKILGRTATNFWSERPQIQG